jgi:peptidyl-prolyl cis-trans isomerase C
MVIPIVPTYTAGSGRSAIHRIPHSLPWPLCAIALGLAAFGCGELSTTEADLVVARVAGQQITTADLEAFSQNIPTGMRRGLTPAEMRKDLLESLIDKTVLLMEAEAQNVEENDWYQDQSNTARRNRLLRNYSTHAISKRVTVTEEELQEHFRKTRRDRAIRFSGLMLGTLEEAHQVLRDLADGAQFHQLANERSLHRDTGEKGGDSGGYKLRDQVTPALAGALFELEVGELTEPLRMSFRGQTRWIVFKITDEIPAPYEASADRVLEEVLMAKRTARSAVVLDSLRLVYPPRVVASTRELMISRFAEASSGDVSFEPAQQNLPLIALGNVEITLGRFVDEAYEMFIGANELADSSRVAVLLERVFIPSYLLQQAAKDSGMDDTPEFISYMEVRNQEFLLDALKRMEVDRHISVTEEDARAFYEENPKKFTSPETTVAVEIVVASDTLAQQIMRRLQEGADAVALAMEYTIRPGAKHHQGRINLNIYTQPFFQGVHAVASRMDVGEVGGPVKVPEGYSVFLVEDRLTELSPYDTDSRRRAMAYLKVGRAKHSYVAYVKGLRDRYPVEIFPQALARLGARAATSS